MPDTAPPPNADNPPSERSTVEPGTAPKVASSASRSTRARKSVKPRPRVARKNRGPTATELAALESFRKELVEARHQLDTMRQMVIEVVLACREAEARVAATRAGADAARRAVAEADSAAAAIRGIAEATQVELDRSRIQADQTEKRLSLLQEWLKVTRREFTTLNAEARQAIQNFRTSVDAIRLAEMGGPLPAPEAETEEADESDGADELPTVEPLPPDEQADDLNERLIRLLNDAWEVEKEQIALLKALADECGHGDVRDLLAEHRAVCQQQADGLAKRLESLGAPRTGRREILDQLARRIWEAIHSPHDPGDRAVLALLTALSAAEFQARLYTAVYTYAQCAGNSEIAEPVATYFRAERGRVSQLRTAIGLVVERTARR